MNNGARKFLVSVSSRSFFGGITLGLLAVVIAAPRAALSASSAAGVPAGIVALPACGNDPNANTLALQQAINRARPGATLTLPPGVCVLAKCEFATGTSCVGLEGRHGSALYIGGRTELTLAGAADGTSVLKLDPDPPRDSAGRHGYCGETHLLSIQGSSKITLRGFTVNGSDGELPEDANQCGNGRKIAELMHGVRVLNSTDVTIERMKIIRAHGDGLNLFADLGETTIPRTERISVTDTQFLDNDRAGLSFQRNVGHVTVRGNYFKNSGDDQDLDMEATGKKEEQNRAPYEVEIDNNLFERTQPKLTVTLGSSGVQQRSTGIRFTRNTIRPVSSTSEGGGCIFVIGADNTVIENNTVIGGRHCVTLEARKVSNLQIRNNRFEGFANRETKDGDFISDPVVRITEDVGKRGGNTCGQPPKPPCAYVIHYPEQITVTGNVVVQHVRFSPGLELNNAAPLVVADNTISHTHRFPPMGDFDPADPRLRPVAIDLLFGVQDPQFGFLSNEKTVLQPWSIVGNRLSQFADGIGVAQRKATTTVSRATVNNNVFDTSQASPRGIWLEEGPQTPERGFIGSLTVNGNRFGCGFCGPGCTPGGAPPPFAFVRPPGQAHTGNIGVNVTCQ